MSDKGMPRPSQGEEEYFVREDAEKKRKLALQVKRQLAADEAKQLRDLHFMHCPKCGLQMHEIVFRGVDVDVCFGCNGIFLDRGDIERLQRDNHPVMGAVLNWFKEETKAPGR